MRRRHPDWARLGEEFDRLLERADAADRRRCADENGVSVRTLYRWRAELQGRGKPKPRKPASRRRRKCACRCGQLLPVTATRRRRFLNGTHWQRYNRARDPDGQRRARQALQRRRQWVTEIKTLEAELGLIGMLHHADPGIRELGVWLRGHYYRRRPERNPETGRFE